jgi:hypothetical protein
MRLFEMFINKLKILIFIIFNIGVLIFSTASGFVTQCEYLLLSQQSLHRDFMVVPEFITLMNVNNPEFIQENIRRLYGDAVKSLGQTQKTYLLNYTTHVSVSVAQIFDPIFRSGKLSAELKSTLKAQHQLLIAGHEKRDLKYSGFMADMPGNTDVSSGLMMHEQSMGQLKTAKIILKGFGFSEIPLKGPFPEKIWIHGLAEQMRSAGINPESDSENTLNYFPRNLTDSSGRVIHVYPRFFNHIQEMYLKRMVFVLEHLENCLLRPHPYTPLRNVLSLIAEYYHLGINAHLFERGNNSLLMSQVNYFLKYLGLNPIRHQYWDYVALINHSDDFERIFIEAIKEVNHVPS